MTRLETILSAVRGGAGGAGEVARRTGMDIDTVETGLAMLAAAGRIRRELVFATACAPTGCGSCPISSGCAATGSPSGKGLRAWRAA